MLFYLAFQQAISYDNYQIEWIVTVRTVRANSNNPSFDNQMKHKGYNTMMDQFTTLCSRCLRHVLKAFCIGRFHSNRIVFFSYFGKQYSCNPKYISDYLKEHVPSYELVWAFQKPEAFSDLEKKGIRIIRYCSLSFLHICLTSRYIITNSEVPSWFPLTKRQTLINTWHGGGAYKKVGASYTKETKGKQDRAALARELPCVYLSSSKAFTKLTLEDSFHHTGEVLAYGMPRNDFLVKQNRPDFIEKVKKHFSLDSSMHIALYAPTYREDKLAKDYQLDCIQLKEVLHKRFGGTWCILYRMHYFVMEQFAASNDYIDASSYPDMQELLYAADVLITDYSSCMWDFALTYKPCFLYTTDLSCYDMERGFYTNIHTWPYPLSESMNELSHNIEQFNEKRYRKNIAEHFETLGCQETGDATQKVVTYLDTH
jgi:CDP-glycerol glycerophosphotransferase